MITAYVGMEAGGWKGTEGTDIGATPGGLRFFTRSLTEMHAAGLAVAYQLSAGGIPIAQTWLLTGADRNVAMAWKMAYDDTYRKMSPGLLMQIDALGMLHARAASLREIDSCAAPNHPMWSWFWPARRQLQHLIVAPRGPLNALLVRIAVSVRSWRQRNAAARAGAQEQGHET